MKFTIKAEINFEISDEVIAKMDEANKEFDFANPRDLTYDDIWLDFSNHLNFMYEDKKYFNITDYLNLEVEE